jgi:hypothetical protein
MALGRHRHLAATATANWPLRCHATRSRFDRSTQMALTATAKWQPAH